MPAASARREPPARRAAAWLVHAYTASGAVCALAALVSAVRGRLDTAFAWLALQMAIDATDGALARLADVKGTLPVIDGSRLDDIVDYLTYVFVPAAIVVIVPLVPGPAGWLVAAAVLMSSALGFANVRAKTSDHFFTGFPSYWNIVLLYLVAFGTGPLVNALVLILFAALVFVPIRYVYPSRTPVFRTTTIALGTIWAALMLVVIASLPDPPRAVLALSLAFPIYYAALSLALEWRRRP